MSGVLAIIRPGVKFTYYLNILFDTVTKFVGNIEGKTRAGSDVFRQRGKLNLLQVCTEFCNIYIYTATFAL